MKTICEIMHTTTFPFMISNLNGNPLYFENDEGYWWKYKYDSNGDRIYCANSWGYIDEGQFELFTEWSK